MHSSTPRSCLGTPQSFDSAARWAWFDEQHEILGLIAVGTVHAEKICWACESARSACRLYITDAAEIIAHDVLETLAAHASYYYIHTFAIQPS